MTRCMNCGAEMSDERCEACGLTPTAAEFSVRSKLLNRTAVFLLGAVAFVVAAGRYPALELDGILIFIGVVFFATLGIAIWLERRTVAHQDVDLLKRLYYGLIPLPWLLALLLIANGAFDTSKARSEPARIISKFSMPGPIPSRRLIVTSWRDGHRLERIAVDRVDFDRFTKGDLVNVQVHEGLASIPWVSAVSMQ